MEQHERPDEMLCPITNDVIGAEVCYELTMSLLGAGPKLASIPEVSITDIERAKKICDQCPYSDLD